MQVKSIEECSFCNNFRLSLGYHFVTCVALAKAGLVVGPLRPSERPSVRPYVRPSDRLSVRPSVRLSATP